MRYLVSGEIVAADGQVHGGDGGKFEADSPEEAEAAFRAVQRPEVPGVWSWRVTVEEA